MYLYLYFNYLRLGKSKTASCRSCICQKTYLVKLWYTHIVPDYYRLSIHENLINSKKKKKTTCNSICFEKLVLKRCFPTNYLIQLVFKYDSIKIILFIMCALKNTFIYFILISWHTCSCIYLECVWRSLCCTIQILF